MTRAAEITAFLKCTAYAGGVPAWLAGDASTRRYARVASGRLPSAILMDAPAEECASNTAFHDITLRLRSAGYAAPEILAADVPRGLMLLEDLGPDLFAAILSANTREEQTLYGAAVDLLVDLRGKPELAKGLQPYDSETYAKELTLVTNWYLPVLTGTAATPRAHRLLDAVLEAIGQLDRAPTVCVLRDYHAENLLWLPGREGHARVGLLDYQDALAGHPAYDLVSLLEDARRDTSPKLQADMRARYASKTGVSLAEVERAVAVLGAQRNLKILGIFARLFKRDGKARYLSLLPRVWDHLQRDLHHPALANAAALADGCLPAPTAARLASLTP